MLVLGADGPLVHPDCCQEEAIGTVVLVLTMPRSETFFVEEACIEPPCPTSIQFFMCKSVAFLDVKYLEYKTIIQY